MFRFRELSGGEVVLRVLGDIRRGEEERREAAGVLAQVLSPWIDGNTNIQEIDAAMTDIVISLKGWKYNYFYPGRALGVEFVIFTRDLTARENTLHTTHCTVGNIRGEAVIFSTSYILINFI